MSIMWTWLGTLEFPQQEICCIKAVSSTTRCCKKQFQLLGFKYTKPTSFYMQQIDN